MPKDATKDSLPEGWQRCRLPDFVALEMGQSPPSRTYNERGDGLPFFQGKAEFGDLYPSIEKYCSEPKKIAQPGATLLSVRAPVGPTNLAPETCCIGRGLAALHPEGGIDPKFVLYLFRAIEPKLSSSGTGSTFKAIGKSFLQSLEVDLPPLPEQNRIVAKVEELLSELDKGVESLEMARTQLQVYRQALLKHAFDGKLTADWRQEHGRTSPQAATHQRSGPKYLPDLPQGWSYRELGASLSERPRYGTSKKCDYEFEGRGVLRIPNIASGVIDASDLKGADFTEDEASKYALQSGDILVIRSNGSVSLVGKPALISASDEQYLFAGYLIRLRSDPAILRPEYLALALSSHSLRTQIEAAAKSTSGVHNINAKELQSLLVPTCPVQEQDAIVERLDSRLSSLEMVAAEIDTEIRRAQMLRHAVLRRAFTGQLFAQDSADEPASVLLERIQCERDLSKNNKKRKAAS